MKQKAQTTSFYVETLLLIAVFVAIILGLTQIFGLAEAESSRSEQLTGAVMLAENACRLSPADPGAVRCRLRREREMTDSEEPEMPAGPE